MITVLDALGRHQEGRQYPSTPCERPRDSVREHLSVLCERVGSRALAGRSDPLGSGCWANNATLSVVTGTTTAGARVGSGIYSHVGGRYRAAGSHLRRAGVPGWAWDRYVMARGRVKQADASSRPHDHFARQASEASCGAPAVGIDHLIPIADDGDDSLANLRPALRPLQQGSALGPAYSDSPAASRACSFVAKDCTRTIISSRNQNTSVSSSSARASLPRPVASILAPTTTAWPRSMNSCGSQWISTNNSWVLRKNSFASSRPR